MKHIYALVLLLTAGICGAQIQITQANMPSLGDTIRYTNASAGTFDFSQTGADYNWNYYLLKYIDQGVYSYKSLLSAYPTLVIGGMPFGAIGYKVADSLVMGPVRLTDIYNFYEKKSSGWLGVGTAFSIPLMGNPVPTGAVYSDKDEIYTFPLKYNDRDSTTFAVTTPLGLSQQVSFGSFMQKGYRITKVEGWGRISTPYGSYMNCIKVKSTIVEHDSLALAIPTQPGINIGFPVTRVEYKWLSTTEKIPLLEVSGTELAGIFTPAYVRYRDNYRTNVTPVIPNTRFTIDKTSGKAGKDTFRLINLTTPAAGTFFVWYVKPSLQGVRFVNSTGQTSKDPVLIFDDTGVFSIGLKASNIAGLKDTLVDSLVTITKDQVNSINSIGNDNKLFYPNPVNGKLNFYSQDLRGTVCRIFDATGKMLIETAIGDDQQIDCRSLPPGAYNMILLNTHILIHNRFIKI